jgi:hypothetical protein
MTAKISKELAAELKHYREAERPRLYREKEEADLFARHAPTDKAALRAFKAGPNFVVRRTDTPARFFVSAPLNPTQPPMFGNFGQAQRVSWPAAQVIARSLSNRGMSSVAVPRVAIDVLALAST